MAKEASVKWTCDRCNKKATTPLEYDYEQLPENWVKIEEWQLCHRCHMELLAWMMRPAKR